MFWFSAFFSPGLDLVAEYSTTVCVNVQNTTTFDPFPGNTLHEETLALFQLKPHFETGFALKPTNTNRLIYSAVQVSASNVVNQELEVLICT